MRKFKAGLLMMTLIALLSHAATAADCSRVSDNAIGDANVANLQQMQAAAEARAAAARTADERRRWEATARSLAAQAQAAQSRDASMSKLAQELCDKLTNSDDDDD